MAMPKMTTRQLGLLAGGALMTLVAGCASAPAPVTPTPPPVVVAPAPMPMPVPPNSAALTTQVPPKDPMTGRRLTVNANLGPEQSLWQYRIALNVAALNCRGPNEDVLVANYTRFLNSHRTAIARAERWVITEQGRLNRTNGIAARDALSTKLFNYFAMPPVHGGFCSAATESAALAAQEPTANILPFAILHLTRVDQPFVDFYQAFEQYRVDYARWQTLQPGYVAPTVTAPATPATTTSTTPAPAGPSSTR